ncbi:hypothetical protein Tco_0019361 [Tanacetum coccineum]
MKKEIKSRRRLERNHESITLRFLANTSVLLLHLKEEGRMDHLNKIKQVSDQRQERGQRLLWTVPRSQIYLGAVLPIRGSSLDADWAGCPVTRSAEAEYRGVANVVAETAAVYMSTNHVQHQHTKHIEIDIHFVREYVASGQVRVLHVPSRFQFCARSAVIDAAQRKRDKYMAKCAALGESEADAVTLLKRIRKFSMTQDIGARAAVHIFNKISFVIAKRWFKGISFNLWRCYINFIRKASEKKEPEGQEETRKAYDFMLSYVGSDIAFSTIMCGPVQDVRIPYQQKRMFGFRRVKQMERGDFSSCGSPMGFDSRDPFDLGARMLYKSQDLLWRKKFEEQADLQHAVELQNRRLMDLQLLDVKRNVLIRRRVKQMEHGDFSSCGSPTGFDSRDPFDLGERMLYKSQDLLWRKKFEEQADLQHAVELQNRRLMDLQLLDVKRNYPDSGNYNFITVAKNIALDDTGIFMC